MKVETPNSDPSAVPQEKMVFGREARFWSPAEIMEMKAIAAGVVTEAMIREKFPLRSVKSVKNRLAEIRREMGIVRKESSNLGERAVIRLPSLAQGSKGMDDGEFARRRTMAERGSARMLERLIACHG